jgi:hypothetical protein
MPSLAHKRGTRAQIDAAASANALKAGEIYLISDEARLTVGTAVNAHQALAKQGEGGGSASDPRRNPVYETDFLTKNAVQPPFIGGAILAGTNTTGVTGAQIDQNHPGQWLLRSSATANSGYQCTTLADIRIGGGEVFDLVFKTTAGLTGTTLRCGFLDTVTSADAVDGVYFEMPPTGAIIGKTSANSVRSSTATLATLATSTWYHVRLTVNAAATSVLFEVFSDAGALLGSASLAANIPTGSGRETACGFVVTNAGTVATDLIYADYMSAKITRALTRGALS